MKDKILILYIYKTYTLAIMVFLNTFDYTVEQKKTSLLRYSKIQILYPLENIIGGSLKYC